MTSLIKVLDIYNDVATVTGFPQYTNETDTPDITRFLLQTLSHALGNTIDSLYVDNNTLERDQYVTTNEGEAEYAIEGLIKHVDLIDENGKVTRLRYDDNADYMKTLTEDDRQGKPSRYVISRGYIRLLPTPDKEYKVKMTISTTDLVLSDNDVFRSDIESIDDVVIATRELGDIIKLRAITLILMRCQNPAAQIYADLAAQRTKTYIEHDYGTREAKRGFSRQIGHYDPYRGLLD